jgi:hypothetical protein
MDINKLKELQTDSKIKINGTDYIVTDKSIGDKLSDEVKEWILKDKNGHKFLLQIVLDNAPDLWKLEIDPIIKKPIFEEKNLIEIKSIEF